MKRYIFTALVALFTSQICFAEAKPIEGLQLAAAPVNYSDMDSIKRGAKFFAGNCMSCHTVAYLRYDPIAKEAGIVTDKAQISLNGVTPPDLSLETDVRGEDWVYTYLHSFYKDSSTASGANNLIFPGTAMPAVLAPFQGEQELVANPTYDLLHRVEWFDLVKPVKQGTMTPEEFDTTMTDLVNFLAYAAQPYRPEAHRLGKWVLGFLVILFVLTYLLKKEYWKDVDKH